jgi:site-specific recombinase XerD
MARFGEWYKEVLGKAEIPMAKNRKRTRGPCPCGMRRLFTKNAFQKAHEAGGSFEDTVLLLAGCLGHEDLSELEDCISTSCLAHAKSCKSADEIDKRLRKADFRAGRESSFPGALAECPGKHLQDNAGLSASATTACKRAFDLLFLCMSSVRGADSSGLAFKDPAKEAIEGFLMWLGSGRRRCVATRNHRLSAISAFAACCADACPVDSLASVSAMQKIKSKRKPKKKRIRHFTKDEIGMLLDLPDTATPIGRRDLAAMTALCCTGARGSELCGIAVGDIQFGKPPSETQAALSGKGGKTRVATVPETCSALLLRYLETRGVAPTRKNADVAVFPTQAHERMSAGCLEEIVKK